MATVTKGRTFVSGETVTPAKLNELVDNATVTSIVDADVSASAAIALSKLATGALPTAITVASANLVDGTIVADDIASGAVTQAKLAINVTTTGPAFRAYASTTTSLPNNAPTKVNLATEDFDTNNNFSNSRFTPTVAGYYQINGSVFVQASVQVLVAYIAKNGSPHSGGTHITGQTYSSSASDLIYMNGTTDYVELFVANGSGTAQTVAANSIGTFMSGFLARAA